MRELKKKQGRKRKKQGADGEKEKMRRTEKEGRNRIEPREGKKTTKEKTLGLVSLNKKRRSITVAATGFPSSRRHHKPQSAQLPEHLHSR